MRILISELTDNHHDTALALIAYAAISGANEIGVVAPPSWASLYCTLSEVSIFIPYEGKTKFSDFIRKIKDFHPTHLIHATAYGKETLSLAKSLKHYRQMGVIHNVAKLRRLSWLQWRMLSYLKFFWVLRPGLYERVPKRYRDRSDFLWTGVYPASLEAQIPVLPAEEGITYLAIPGRIEYKRRAYGALLEVLDQLRQKERFRFILLGPAEGKYSDYPDFFRRVRARGWERLFVSFSEVVPFPLYHAYLRLSAAVLALLHPHQYPEHRVYLRDQISGAFALAQSHRKPLLLHRCFAGETDLADCSYFYDSVEDLAQLLDGLAAGRVRTEHLYQSKWYSIEDGIGRFRRGLEAI